MSGHLDFASIKSSVRMSAVVGVSMKLNPSGREFVGCCPFHEDLTPSFTVSDEKGFAHCFGCGWHGDVLDFVAQIDGCTLHEAAERLGAGNLPIARPGNIVVVDFVKTATIEAARRIWRDAKPIGGTPAELYLRRRGIHMPLPPTLRFARLKHPSGAVHPCLVALAISAKTSFAGIQRTYLTD
ncbi:MAG TPA: CHC2 zinc finger domain-containing protein, partial [Sphingomicrobium sp.]|nr:CHC2 zinc finger domain-containing protein [Sphingomicrobium sp.]